MNTSNGDVNEQIFSIARHLLTQTYGFDIITIFMPLAKAQAITQTENHASTILILLKDKAQTDVVAAALQIYELQGVDLDADE